MLASAQTRSGPADAESMMVCINGQEDAVLVKRDPPPPPSLCFSATTGQRLRAKLQLVCKYVNNTVLVMPGGFLLPHGCALALQPQNQ